MSTPLVILFLKAPLPGKVKTRLAAEVGDHVAVGVYRQLVENQIRHIPPHWRIRIAHDPPDALGVFHAWLGDRHDYTPQSTGDLGDRLAAAADRAFEEGHETVFCIGGDCPNLCPDTFAAAQALLLEGNDLVFIPAEDGGYVLAGLRTPCPEIFQNIPWSSGDTLRVSLERARQHVRKVALMPPLFDVDTLADLERATRETGFHMTNDE
ncbi:MAG: TIGR04282 family arsenosugar biosynthesis glycosyltransferase [Verrucomicrobia bacterium]|nr:TIGR04282 family arsenosugar biosynthesis glycosyltransferase [Verrucomicrobiota bacterium]MCH8527700.1 TIGR04282 family arsenosugar biosynthesis glycosyltransferase [Kiritimatiellia bacterium]